VDELIYYGGAIKALGNGKVGGYLVEFTDLESQKGAPPDLTKEFFTKSTDYDIEPEDKRTVYFNHGQDSVLKRRKLSKAELKVDEVGVWAETILDTRDKYLAKIYEMAEAGKLGWSSGSTPHLVEKKAVKNGFFEIIAWPIVEASLTHTPCNPVSRAVPLKSFFEESNRPEVKAVDGTALLIESLRQTERRVWELWDALQTGSRKIAEAAASSDVTGVEVNVRDAVTALVNALDPRLVDAIVPQIEDWLKAENRNEHFYLKSTRLDEFIASSEGLVSGLKLGEHSEAVVSAVEGFAKDASEITSALKTWVTRTSDKQEFRAAKDGRPISKANRDRMAEVESLIPSVVESLQAISVTLKELMALAEPKAEKSVPLPFLLALEEHLNWQAMSR
jgi:hypothetical protein